MTTITHQMPAHLKCEARNPVPSTKMSRQCGGAATHIYGPECEAETGQLMYLCDAHAVGIQIWRDAHPNDPVECKTHGRIGPVKSYLILRRM